ncbi:MAG: outer membrane beta-barrel family protein [Saprospiraceae bacterium]
MKQLNFILFVTLVFTSIQLIGQTASVRGTVISAEGVLDYATVIVHAQADSTIVKVGATNESGQYRIPGLSAGTYFLEVSYVGLNTALTETFTLTSTALKLEPITLQAQSAEIASVEVIAKRPMIEVLADKTVFNVENTLNATGTDGFELLRKAPGVIVDNNNNIIVDGKTGVQIFINGKPSILAGDDLVNYLRSLQSSDIAAVEIITQPSSKYDAAGNAGIINIRLKKDKRLGTNGSLNAGYAYGQNSRYNGSLSLNKRTKSSNLYGNYSGSTGTTFSFINLDRTQFGVRYDSESETLSDNTAHNFKIGYDWFPDDKHTFGVLVDANLFSNTGEGFTNTPIIPLNTGNLSQTLVSNSNTRGDNQNLNGNLNYRFQDTLGHELTFDLDYGIYSRDQNNFQPNRYLDGRTDAVLFERNYRMITPTNIDIFSAKLDYSQDALGGKLALGGRISLVETDNDFRFFNVTDGSDFFDDTRSNRFLYTEQINAAYVNYNRKWEKWNIQLGLRAEQTISEGDLISAQSTPEDNVRRNYLNFFPSGGLTYTPSYTSSWALTYSRRIQRPTYQSLNPFESQIDELSFSRGNPFLQPQYTDNIKLSHTYKYRLTTSLSYSKINDFFAKVTETLGEDRNFIMSRNIANQEIWNVGVSYPFEVKKWWSVYLSLNAFHAAYEGNDDNFIAIDQSTLSFYGQNSFKLPAGFSFELSGWYSSPSVWSGTYLTKSMGSLDFAVQKKLMDDQLTVRVSMSDILFTSPWEADMRFGDLYIDGTGGWESRQVRVNISYAFGNQNVKKARNRKTGSEDEKSRLGS